MPKRLFIVLAASAAFFAPSLAEAKVKAVASFSIIGDMVARVGGEHVDLTTIVEANGDAHVYEPRPRDGEVVSKADVVFVNGLGFEGWQSRLIEASGYKGKIMELAQGVEPLLIPDNHEHENEEHAESDHDHGHGSPDPHAWQSVANVKIYVKNIAASLCEIDKATCPAFEANAGAYTKELDALEAEIKASVERIPADKRLVITSHDAFGYFAKAYAIKFLAPEGVSTESEASAKDVVRLIKQIRSTKATALFVENITDKRLTEQIASETGLVIGGSLYSDALSDSSGPAPTYIDMMRHNAKLLTDAMAGS